MASFVAALALCLLVWAFSSCGEQGLPFTVGLLTAELRLQGLRASVVAAHGPNTCGVRALECRLSSREAWA